MPSINNYINFLYRNISLFSKLHHGNSRKLKVISESGSTKKVKNADLKAEKNRTSWEKEIEHETVRIGKICSDNVYFTKEYENKLYSLRNAIDNHRDCLLDKSMLDSPQSVLDANFTLNMKTKKTTKFIQKLYGVAIPKHVMDFLPRPKIIAFCQTPEQVEIALTKGAYLAGNESLMKKLRTGEICYEEFDQVVSHVDTLPALSKLKPALKDKFPMKGTPRVGDDIQELVSKFVNGYEFESRKVDGIPEQAYLTIPLGEIGWTVDQLVDNFRIFLKEILSNSSKQISGNPIDKVTLTCRPSDEIFHLDLSNELKEVNV